MTIYEVLKKISEKDRECTELVESKFIVSAMSDIKNQILEQLEIKER